MGINNYTVTYSGTECSIAVTTLPAGGASPAVFTLNGAPGTCLNYNLMGTYTTNVALTVSNKVDISINVTTIGTYNITTTASNGMTFSGSGALINTGVQTITLAGQGTPTAAGTTNIPVTAGTSTCSFAVPVVGPAVYTVDCSSATVNGTYTQGVALDGTNTVNINVSVATIGGYSISGTINGMTFSGSGTFTGTGTQPVVLAGSGTPTAAGAFNVPISAGTSHCDFSVTVVAGATVDWKFNQGTALFQGSFDQGQLLTTSVGPVTITAYSYSGVTTAGETFDFALADISGGIQANETYSSNATGTNTAIFQYVGNTLGYTAPGTTATVNMVFKVLTHNTTTKTITGTFSGTAEDDNGVSKPITNGTFQGSYP
jgi:hypothetical protein